MFNNSVINLLTQVNGITNSVILKYPTTVANSPAGDILVNIPMDKLDEDTFTNLGIYNLGEFLNTFKLFGENREVSIENDVISVSEGEMSLQYISNNINLMTEFDKNPDIFTKTESVPTVASFIMTEEDIKKLKQASGVFKDLTDVVFKSQDGEISISLAATGRFNSKSNNFTLTKSAETTKEFDVIIPVDNFKTLPGGEYEINVKYNESRQAYRVIFNSKDLEDFKVLMAVKKV